MDLTIQMLGTFVLFFGCCIVCFELCNYSSHHTLNDADRKYIIAVKSIS